MVSGPGQASQMFQHPQQWEEGNVSPEKTEPLSWPYSYPVPLPSPPSNQVCTPHNFRILSALICRPNQFTATVYLNNNNNIHLNISVKKDNYKKEAEF